MPPTETRAFLSHSGKAIVERFDFLPGKGDVFAGHSSETLTPMYITNFGGNTGDERYDYLMAADASLQGGQEVRRRGDALTCDGETYYYQPGLEHQLQLPLNDPDQTRQSFQLEDSLLIDVYYRVDGAYVVVTQAPDSTYHIHIGEKNEPMSDIIVTEIRPDLRNNLSVVLTTPRGRLIPGERSATWGQPGKYITLTRLLSSDYRLVVRSGKFILEWI